ncbi:FAD-dependent oxidoreductase [Streptomyces cirratus]
MAVDSGFIVHNERTYPTLLRLFGELGVATQDTEMSMSVRCDGCRLEYAGARGPRGLFASRAALRSRTGGCWQKSPSSTAAPAPASRGRRDGARPDVRGLPARRRVLPLLHQPFRPPAGLGGVVLPRIHGHGLSRRLPLHLPVHHHGLLSVTGSPQWKTVTGGSAAYVSAVAKHIQRVRTSSPVQAVRRTGGRGAVITTRDGATDTYDGVVIATHPDQALSLLADPTRGEAAPGSVHLLPQPHRAAHRHLPATPFTAGKGRLELPPHRLPTPQAVPSASATT